MRKYAFMVVLLLLLPLGKTQVDEEVIYHEETLTFDGSGMVTRTITANPDDMTHATTGECIWTYDGVLTSLTGDLDKSFYLIGFFDEDTIVVDNYLGYISHDIPSSVFDYDHNQANRTELSFYLGHPFEEGDPDRFKVAIFYTGDSTAIVVLSAILQINSVVADGCGGFVDFGWQFFAYIPFIAIPIQLFRRRRILRTNIPS